MTDQERTNIIAYLVSHSPYPKTYFSKKEDYNLLGFYNSYRRSYDSKIDFVYNAEKNQFGKPKHSKYQLEQMAYEDFMTLYNKYKNPKIPVQPQVIYEDEVEYEEFLTLDEYAYISNSLEDLEEPFSYYASQGYHIIPPYHSRLLSTMKHILADYLARQEIKKDDNYELHLTQLTSVYEKMNLKSLKEKVTKSREEARIRQLRALILKTNPGMKPSISHLTLYQLIDYYNSHCAKNESSQIKYIPDTWYEQVERNILYPKEDLHIEESPYLVKHHK